MTRIPNHEPNPQDGKYSSRYLSRNRVVYWEEAAYTVLTSPRGASLHPGPLTERSEYMGDFNLTPQQPANGLTVLELFCGGGLGAIGFKAAGYNIVKALDFDKNAVKAYHHNFGDHVEQADINAVDIDDLPNTDVIFGGPPCQDFSVAGKGAGADGERGKLVWRYLEIIERKKPKSFVFENVKGLITKRHRPTFDALIEKFNEIGYEISWQVINAWHYGVAQKRERVFIVGIRKDLGITFEFPTPLEGDYQTKVLRDVIGELPEVNNEGYGMRNDEKPYAHKIPDGGNWRSLPEDEQKAFMKGAFYSGGGQTTYLRRMSRDEPALTVTASVMAKATCQLHPKESGKAPRRFTVRECLRIQSAPDTYVLPDDISLSAQYRIVGNGIASRVAWYIGCALADQLRFKSKA
ncbi:DNA cytosine methyltransferase [Bacillus velezensis]|uniref:DNA cytosine methyltransferase n=1 Tax=Bacillus velezensis TaxID=492670 RepID=UPI0037845DFC